MAVCIACGTENRDNANFCRGCATSMVALAGTQIAARAPAQAAPAEYKGPTQACPACQARNPLVATSCKNCGTSLVPDMAPAAKTAPKGGAGSMPPGASPGAVPSASPRQLLWMVAGVALVAAAAGVWWLTQGSAQPAPAAAVEVNNTPQALGVGLSPATAPPPQAPLDATPAAPPPVDEVSTAAAAEQADRIKKQAAGVTDADRKRRQLERQQKEARERAAAERQRVAQEQARRQAELDRQRAEEAERQRAQAAARPAPPPEPVRTVDAVCASSGNFIAREVCRTRECRSPAFANDPVCVRFREVEAANRRQPTD